MADYRNLPMAPHDVETLADGLAHKTFENFVRLEHDVAGVLQQLLRQDQAMLHQMTQ
jgi:hypothetical protein